MGLGIDLLILLTHTTHKLQRLDVNVFEPLRITLRSEGASWMEMNPGIEVKIFELAEVTSKALKMGLTLSNIKVGFRKIGIWPLNYDILIHDMACSQAFDVHGHENSDVADNMLSLSQGHC